ncbi:type VI secretion system, core protein [Erwinia sp. OLTSP20]|uniref:type VI secretion system-associated FHA domain protein TagH n=1 Tax=unclassified Erwinia TaxID=2622719 RepID=UPI000C193539|nr:MULTISPECIES: type VI secretion system-associated FHA domain protein TagH [unclassified Erwinia]PIJ49974.1 type VI secretion system, core protein [Erwinia sp. OAMSP11]PIJ71378.1 type VI secretion system, core protein [Erwinia sp. OLSSP12]PIJ80613.1 type VI secretion system, core protein [Erwinia sp. OLCASP19]PIJ82791.1 type VI secretion system, core protein [Erwinia sp. OLMTSP26]PIJ85476.1 type VI secretion system, core protein [Erwinia sp. OLMDSP33]
MRFTLVDSRSESVIHQVDFQPPGGTIGRSSNNDLILPDAARAISRLQALVHIAADGECRLTSHGSVIPVVLHGQPLARGEQVVLQEGDTLTIGNYRLKVGNPGIQQKPPGDDPLALFHHPSADTADPLGIFSDLPTAAASRPISDIPASDAPDRRLGINPVCHESGPTSGSRAPRSADENQQMIQALLEGMGLDNPDETILSAEQMRTTGQMLSLFAQGMVALLSSRTILKRGVKAELTMILNEANNPFKILPSGKTVLMQMYQSEMPGFMPPEQAVRDALVDLQAHQLGMIAGIRAIIAAMLQSFNPQRLEQDARQHGVLPRLALTTQKKAALWDYFCRHYQHAAGELEDDFHTLFGEAFLHAYDMEVRQYKDSQTPTEQQ